MRKKFFISALILAIGIIVIMLWRTYPIIRLRFLVPQTPTDLALRRIPPQTIRLPAPVPILMYHHIATVPNGGDILYVSPEHFATQLEWLKEHGYQTVGLDYIRHPSAITGKPVILTFDDGYHDAYEQAFPLLRSHDFQGTFYIVTNDLDKFGFLNEIELLEMASNGMRFGSHTLSHPDLTAITPTQVGNETYGSKKLLERILGVPVTDFCYPGGRFTPDTETIVTNSGYLTATTTVDDTNTGAIDPFALNRIPVRDDTDFDHIPAILARP